MPTSRYPESPAEPQLPHALTVGGGGLGEGDERLLVLSSPNPFDVLLTLVDT